MFVFGAFALLLGLLGLLRPELLLFLLSFSMLDRAARAVGVGLWEGPSALATGLALYLDSKQRLASVTVSLKKSGRK